VHIVLRREGWDIGRNLVYRLYREEGLVLRTKRPRRRKMVVHREAHIQPKRPNEAWSLDIIHNELSNGQKLRALTVVDIFTQEVLAIEVGHRLRGENVVNICSPIMVPSLPVSLLIFRRITTEHASTSHVQASQPTSSSSKPLTEHCGTNA